MTYIVHIWYNKGMKTFIGPASRQDAADFVKTLTGRVHHIVLEADEVQLGF